MTFSLPAQRCTTRAEEGASRRWEAWLKPSVRSKLHELHASVLLMSRHVRGPARVLGGSARTPGRLRPLLPRPCARACGAGARNAAAPSLAEFAPFAFARANQLWASARAPVCVQVPDDGGGLEHARFPLAPCCSPLACIRGTRLLGLRLGQMHDFDLCAPPCFHAGADSAASGRFQLGAMDIQSIGMQTILSSAHRDLGDDRDPEDSWQRLLSIDVGDSINSCTQDIADRQRADAKQQRDSADLQAENATLKADLHERNQEIKELELKLLDMHSFITKLHRKSESPVYDDKVPAPRPSDGHTDAAAVAKGTIAVNKKKRKRGGAGIEAITAMVCSPDNGASSASFNSSLVSAEVNENATADQPSGLEIQGLSYLPPTGDNIYDNNSIQDTTEIGVIAEDEAMIPLDRLPAKLRKLAHPPEGCYSTGLQLRARGPGSRSGGNRSREVKKPRVKVYIKRGPDGLLLYMDDFTERSKNLAIKINTWVTTHISEDCIKRGPVTHPILDFAEVKFTQDQWADLATHVGNIRGNRTQNKSTLPPVQRDQKYLSQFFNEFLSMPCPDDRTREGSFWPWRSFDAQHYNLQAFRHTTWGMACRGHVNGEAIGRPLIEVCDPIAEDSNAKSKDGITSA